MLGIIILITIKIYEILIFEIHRSSYHYLQTISIPILIILIYLKLASISLVPIMLGTHTDLL